jgi:hypothetical protein
MRMVWLASSGKESVCVLRCKVLPWSKSAERNASFRCSMNNPEPSAFGAHRVCAKIFPKFTIGLRSYHRKAHDGRWKKDEKDDDETETESK